MISATNKSRTTVNGTKPVDPSPSMLVAGALAYYTIKAHGKKSNYNDRNKNRHHLTNNDCDGNSYDDDNIPDLFLDYDESNNLPVRDSKVKPVDNSSSPSLAPTISGSSISNTTDSFSLSNSPHRLYSGSPQRIHVKPRVTAASLLQMQSRQRAQNALHHHHHSKITTTVKTGASSAFVPIKQSQQHNNNNKVASTTTTTTTPPVVSVEIPHHHQQQKSTHEEETDDHSHHHYHYQHKKVHFKVKFTNRTTVLRFHCEPTYDIIQANIIARLAAIGETVPTTNSTTNTESNNTSLYNIQFQDAEDNEWCGLLNDDDVYDAIQGAIARKDTMVRLQIIEPETTTSKITNAISSLGGYITNFTMGW